MSYDEDELGAEPMFGGADDDLALDDDLEPLPGMEDFGLDEEDPDKDH